MTELPLILVAGAIYVSAIYLMLSRHVIRNLIGVALLGNAVNLTLFVAGRLTAIIPPIIPDGEVTLSDAAANPLPQALILTAIVISFSFFAFLLVLAWRAFETLGTDDTHEMRHAEPEDGPGVPRGY